VFCFKINNNLRRAETGVHQSDQVIGNRCSQRKIIFYR